MRRSKKYLMALCITSLLTTVGASPAFADAIATPSNSEIEAEAPEETVNPEDIANELETVTVDIPFNILEEILQKQAMISSEYELNLSAGNYDLTSGGSMIYDFTEEQGARSASSITQQFTDYITEPGVYKYVQFGLAQGEIFNGSLLCPNNEDLNYDLLLCTVSQDGRLTIIDSSELGTYIDPKTNKTVDEGISYIHEDAALGNYAVVVMPTQGSSTTESFTLTVSIDVAGSYDNNEPNDSAFSPTIISMSSSLPYSASASGSLHVINDQDWYAVSAQPGTYKATAGNNNVEIYYAMEGNKLELAPKSEAGNFALGTGTYFIKVSSSADFTEGNYTLQLVDQSKYTTLSTAYNFGDWETAYSKHPEPIPVGQSVNYYKFTIDPEDKTYIDISLATGSSGVLVEALDESGETFDYGFTGNDEIDARGIITKYGRKYVVVNVNGTQTNRIAYIRITRLEPMSILSGFRPGIADRILSGNETFKVSGTAYNDGGTYSSVLKLNLTNESSIPPKAVVDSVSLSGDISQTVGGIQHQLNPYNLGWIAATPSLADSGTFKIGAENNIELKRNWQYRYYQSALASTRLKNVELRFSWKYDIKNTNYLPFTN